MHLYLETGGFDIDKHENAEHGYCLLNKAPMVLSIQLRSNTKGAVLSVQKPF